MRIYRSESTWQKWPTAVLVALLLLTGDALAQMYQWRDPATQNMQLSGVPPAWYRGQRGGPRVLVFRNGKLVDDTSVPVSAEHRETLRQSAFGLKDDKEKTKVAAREPADGGNPICRVSELQARDDLLQELSRRYEGAFSTQRALLESGLEAYQELCDIPSSPEANRVLARLSNEHYPNFATILRLYGRDTRDPTVLAADRRADPRDEEPEAGEEGGGTIESLKAIIRAWDRRNSELDSLIQQAQDPNRRR